jgi:hypothetical protein
MIFAPNSTDETYGAQILLTLAHSIMKAYFEENSLLVCNAI